MVPHQNDHNDYKGTQGSTSASILVPLTNSAAEDGGLRYMIQRKTQKIQRKTQICRKKKKTMTKSKTLTDYEHSRNCCQNIRYWQSLLTEVKIYCYEE